MTEIADWVKRFWDARKAGGRVKRAQITAAERRMLIEEAVAAGRVTRCPTACSAETTAVLAPDDLAAHRQCHGVVEAAHLTGGRKRGHARGVVKAAQGRAPKRTLAP